VAAAGVTQRHDGRSIERHYGSGMSSESYHEPIELLSETTKDMHRAVVSLREELDAVDWYGQRAEACGDPELRAVLLHNRDEEIEHAMMVLEWLRRRDPAVAANIDRYLHAAGPIVAHEQVTKEATTGAGATPSAMSLGIGSLKGAR
jgi:ferritin-like protein